MNDTLPAMSPLPSGEGPGPLSAEPMQGGGEGRLSPAVNSAIIIRGLVKTFEEGRIQALRGVDLEVKKGDFVAVMGPSGCGKSTLLSLIGALDTPTSGDIIVEGSSLTTVKDLDRFRSRTVGFIFQAFYLLPLLTTLENVQIPMFETIFSPRQRRKKAEELLRMVGLEERMDQVPTTLSGGERQRVAIARSLANDPRILLGDEPTGNLDSRTAESIIGLLMRINQERGTTLLVVTHDGKVASHAHRIIKLLDGKVVHDNPT